MGEKTALIFGAMDQGDWSFLAPLRGAAVFCADGGLRCAEAAGFTPDYYIGDGDSGGSPPPGVPAKVLPVRKDLTDLQAAWEQVYALGFRRIVLTGCTGGRQDHHIAALQLLETIARRGCEGLLLDPDNEIRFCPPGDYVLEPGRFRFFSILPVEAQLTATIRHALYPLEAGVLRRGDSLGVSNAFLDGPARLSLAGGGCWLVQSGRLK